MAVDDSWDPSPDHQHPALTIDGQCVCLSLGMFILDSPWSHHIHHHIPSHSRRYITLGGWGAHILLADQWKKHSWQRWLTAFFVLPKQCDSKDFSEGRPQWTDIITMAQTATCGFNIWCYDWWFLNIFDHTQQGMLSFCSTSRTSVPASDSRSSKSHLPCLLLL